MITAQLCGEVYRVRSTSLCTPGMSQGRTTKGRRAYGVPLRPAQGKGSLLYACPVAMEFRHLEYCFLSSRGKASFGNFLYIAYQDEPYQWLLSLA
jgi:hypothetical protein